MAHARLFFPPHLIGRGVTFMNFVFIGGAGLIQWFSGLFVGTAERTGMAPATNLTGMLYARLLLLLLRADRLPAVARPDRNRVP